MIIRQCLSMLREKLYKTVPQQKYPRLHRLAAKMIAMFGFTYACEQLFSITNFNKSRYRTSMSDVSLRSILFLSAAKNIKPRFDLYW